MNENDKLISIIVPVFNVEKYLEKCINSILKSNFKNFELILVDDGSTDKSGQLCDLFEKKDKRVKVIHKENGGLSDARNVGIENSNGEYITFIDSDDFISENLISKLFYASNKYNADIVISGYTDVEEKDIDKEINGVNEQIKETYNIIDRETTYKRMFLQEGMDVGACAKLYKKNIFDNLKYPVGELYEDIKIIDKIIEQCNIIIYTDYKGYYYVQRSGSIMHCEMKKERMSLIEKMQQLLDMSRIKYPDIEEAAIKRYVYCNFHVLGRAILNDEYINESNKIRDNILKYKKIIYKSNVFSKKEKIATRCLNLGLKFYKKVWLFFCILVSKKTI